MAYVINLNEHKSIGTHWIALYVNGDNRNTSNDATYFDIFGVEHIPKEIRKIRRKQNYKYLQNTDIRFDNLWILLYCIY